MDVRSLASISAIIAIPPINYDYSYGLTYNALLNVGIYPLECNCMCLTLVNRIIIC